MRNPDETGPDGLQAGDAPGEFRAIARMLGLDEDAGEAACVDAIERIKADRVPLAEHEAALRDLAEVETQIREKSGATVH